MRTPAAVLIAAVTSLGASGARGLDLLETYELARNNDPVIQAQRLVYEAERKRVPLAKSALRPSVSVRGSHDFRWETVDSDASSPFSSGSETSNVDIVSLEVVQNIFNKPLTIAVDQAVDRVSQAELQLRSAEEQLVLRVANSYFAVLAAADNLELARSEKTAIARQLELAEERLNVGLGTKTDLFDAQARFKLAEAAEINAVNLIDRALRALQELIGATPGDLSPLAGTTPLQRPAPALDLWVRTALDNNVDVLIQTQAVLIARKETDRRQAQSKPIFDLAATGVFNKSDGSVTSGASERESLDLLLRLRLPIYTGGRIKTETLEASLRAEAEEQLLESSRRSAERQTRTAYQDVTSRISQVLALEQAVTASESALEAKEEGFSAGLNTNLDVLDAQRDLFRAKRDYLRARYDYILETLRLEQVAGQLDEADVRRVNTWLQ